MSLCRQVWLREAADLSSFRNTGSGQRRTDSGWNSRKLTAWLRWPRQMARMENDRKKFALGQLESNMLRGVFSGPILGYIPFWKFSWEGFNGLNEVRRGRLCLPGCHVASLIDKEMPGTSSPSNFCFPCDNTAGCFTCNSQLTIEPA